MVMYMEIGNYFKSKKQKYICIFLFVFMITCFIVLGNMNFKNDTKDNIKFSEEFKEVPEDNVFVYKNALEILDYLEDDAIILFGSKLNDFTGTYASILNESAKEYGIKKILYYDFFADRVNNNGNYELIVEKIKPYLYTTDDGRIDINAPMFLVIKDGEVLYSNTENNFILGNVSPEEYWNKFNTDLFKETIKTVFEEFIGVKDDGH